MKVLAGDWPAGTDVRIVGKKLQIQKGVFSFETVDLAAIRGFDIITENNRSSILGKVGWGALGAVALGPLGLLAGVIGGGNKKDRLMSIVIFDGRKMLAKGNAKDAEALSAAVYA